MPEIMIDADGWFKSALPDDKNDKGTTVVLGRFKWDKIPNIPASKAADKPIYTRVLAIEHKVVGSKDISVNKVNKENADKWINRFPEAWEAFTSLDRSMKIEGTPLDLKADDGTYVIDGMSPEKVRMFLTEGIRSMEDFSETADFICERLGFGTKHMRGEIQKYLKSQQMKAAAKPRKDGVAELARVGAV